MVYPDPDLVVRYYEVRLLDYVGFRPQLINCVVCGEQVQPRDQYFSALLGGVLCPDCGSNTPGARPVSKDALRYLRHFQRSDFNEATRAMIGPKTKRELEVLMQHYLTYKLEHNLNTPSFLRHMRKALQSQDKTGEVAPVEESIDHGEA